MSSKPKLSKTQFALFGQLLEEFYKQAEFDAKAQDSRYSNDYGCPNCGDLGCYNVIKLREFLRERSKP